MIAPLSINFLGGYQVSAEVLNEFDIDSYIGILRASVISCGLIFELPIIMFFMTKIGVIHSKGLAKQRRWAILIAFVLGALVTPTFDPITQSMVAGPIIVLFEVGLQLSKLAERGPKKNIKSLKR